MTATRRIAVTLTIAIILLFGWQILHQLVGATALPGPAPTLSYLVRLVPTARFMANAEATLISLTFALVLAHAVGEHRLHGRLSAPLNRSFDHLDAHAIV